MEKKLTKLRTQTSSRKSSWHRAANTEMGPGLCIHMCCLIHQPSLPSALKLSSSSFKPE